MRKTLATLALLGTLALNGCKETKIETSDVLHEDAIISETVYSPSRHGTGIGPTVDITGEGGIGVAITGVDIPEKYAVVFKCQHGKFIIEGKDERHKELWKRFNQGDSVTVSYREIYRATYDDIDDDGDEDLLERVLVKYDFLDAQLKPKGNN